MIRVNGAAPLAEYPDLTSSSVRHVLGDHSIQKFGAWDVEWIEPQRQRLVRSAPPTLRAISILACVHKVAREKSVVAKLAGKPTKQGGRKHRDVAQRAPVGPADGVLLDRIGIRIGGGGLFVPDLLQEDLASRLRRPVFPLALRSAIQQHRLNAKRVEFLLQISGLLH